MRARPFWAIGLLIGLFPLAGLVAPAGADSPEYAVSPFGIGERASYAGPYGLTITVGELDESPSRAGGLVSTVPFGYATGDSHLDFDLLVRTSDGLVEAERAHCRAWGSGGCDPWTDTSWALEGLPGVMGATALQSRTFAAGDSWSVSDSCGACITPLVVSIEAPASDSPTGTSFVAVFSGSLSSPRGYLFPHGRVHMAESSAFPLAFEFAGERYERGDYAPGGTAVPLGAGPPVTYLAPFPSRPFADRLPAEGDAFGDHPTLAEAIGSTAAPTGRRLVLLYSSAREGWTSLGQTTIHKDVDFSWTVQMARDSGGDVVTTYSRRDAQLLPDVLPPLRDEWRRSEAGAAATPTGDCVEQSVPLWDLARHAHSSFSVLTTPGYILLDAIDCARPVVSVYGAHRTATEGPVRMTAPEEVRLDAVTGLALSLHAWRG